MTTHAETSLKYISDTDRSLGATGMTIAMIVMDGSHMLAGIDIDAAPDDMVQFMPEYYFEGNPRLMATASWRRLIENFNLTAGMLIGNVLCRRILGDGKMPEDHEREYLHGVVVEEGSQSCDLDQEEASALFANTYNKLSRLFLNRGVRSIGSEFATRLEQERTLSRLEVLNALSALRML